MWFGRGRHNRRQQNQRMCARRLAHDHYSAHQGVEHDDVNILTMGSRVIGTAIATEVVRAFLNANFSGEERHVRRLKKVMEIEAEN